MTLNERVNGVLYSKAYLRRRLPDPLLALMCVGVFVVCWSAGVFAPVAVLILLCAPMLAIGRNLAG